MILNDSQMEELVAVMKSRLPSLSSLYIFGSGATDTFDDNSDIDLAFTSDQEVSNLIIWDLKNDISLMYNRDVDLMDLHAANTVLQIQVVSGGMRIFAKNVALAEQFETNVFVKYITLNEDRAEILRDIEKRKSIYG